MDFVTLQSERAAEGAVRYLNETKKPEKTVQTIAGEGIGYVVPGILHPDTIVGNVEFFFRVRCLMERAVITARCGDRIIRTMNRQKLMPSVMERLLLTGQQLNSLDDDLIIEVKEVK
ncbi:MAG: hypothetical protein EOM64_10580 [Erysipelotrichia bacterium]|nr:hypothetical protein [Erysipelotrichia bacterium]